MGGTDWTRDLQARWSVVIDGAHRGFGFWCLSRLEVGPGQRGQAPSRPAVGASAILSSMKWRLRFPGQSPKHGIARGVAVFGPRGSNNPESLEQLLGRNEDLASWLATEGERLERNTSGLAIVDSHIDEWREVPSIASRLSNEVGLYFGSVLVNELQGAKWHVWPNGHPVVRVASGRDVDAIELVRRRVRRKTPGLVSSLNDLRGR